MKVVADTRDNIVKDMDQKTESDAVATHTPTLIPAGQVAQATIAGATQADGTTLVQLAYDSSPLQLHTATTSQHFQQADIGQQVACIQLYPSAQLVVIGTMMTASATTQTAANVLDEAIVNTAHSAADTANAISEPPPQDSDDDISLFDDIDDDLPHIENAYQIDDETPEHLVLKAERSLILQCGATNLMLLADGRVKINGKYIHSRASNIQRISGGAVKIN